MIANKHAFYSAMGFHELPADLEQIDDYSGLGQFDLVIASEIIEHLPSPPAREISRWTQAVAAGGRLVVTTPNLGSISHIFRLLWMKPLLPPAEETFGPVGMENEGVHRREYMPRRDFGRTRRRRAADRANRVHDESAARECQRLGCCEPSRSCRGFGPRRSSPASATEPPV